MGNSLRNSRRGGKWVEASTDLILALVNLNLQRVFEGRDLHFCCLSKLSLICFNVIKGLLGANIKLLVEEGSCFVNSMEAGSLLHLGKFLGSDVFKGFATLV